VTTIERPSQADGAASLSTQGDARALDRFWAAMILTRHTNVLQAICEGLPVLAGRLEPTVLKRAYGGRDIPSGDTMITITPEQLDTIEAAGPVQRVNR